MKEHDESKLPKWAQQRLAEAREVHFTMEAETLLKTKKNPKVTLRFKDAPSYTLVRGDTLTIDRELLLEALRDGFGWPKP